MIWIRLQTYEKTTLVILVNPLESNFEENIRQNRCIKHKPLQGKIANYHCN